MSSSQQTNRQDWRGRTTARAKRSTRVATLERRVEALEVLVEHLTTTLLKVISAELATSDVTHRRIVDTALEEAMSVMKQRTRRGR